MHCLRYASTAVLVAACLAAVRPVAAEPPASPVIVDVALDAAGCLTGRLTDVAGRPLADEVWLHQENRVVATTRADDAGRFRFPNREGGLYAVQAAGGLTLLRAWTADAAPPVARREALLVAGELTLRGQRPAPPWMQQIACCKYGFANPVVVGGIIAAAVAIPVIANNSGSDSES